MATTYVQPRLLAALKLLEYIQKSLFVLYFHQATP